MSAFVLPNASFAGKVALVTGGSAGIGRATARAFAAAGASVVLADLDEAGGKAVVQELRDAGQTAVFMQADISQAAEVSRLIADTVATFGRLDCAHNNAGTSGTPAAFTDVTLEDWDAVVRLNLTGVFLCLKHELRVMAPAGRGAIVNTSSGAGVIGFPSLPHYVASKHGVLGLTKTAAQEYARSGIRVNAVCPGTTDTPMMQAFIGGDPGIEKMMKATVPTGELGRPEQVAEAVVWLCSERASFVNGDTMLVDGGTVCR